MTALTTSEVLAGIEIHLEHGTDAWCPAARSWLDLLATCCFEATYSCACEWKHSK